MSLRSFLLFGAMGLYASVPSFAQCSGHSGHGDHSGHQAHSGHQDSGPKVTATNTLCPVMGRPVKVGRDMEVVVGGNTYLVCCDGCGPEMAEHKDNYLDRDGKPLNAPKADEANPTPAPPAGHEGHQH